MPIYSAIEWEKKDNDSAIEGKSLRIHKQTIECNRLALQMCNNPIVNWIWKKNGHKLNIKIIWISNEPLTIIIATLPSLLPPVINQDWAPSVHLRPCNIKTSNFNEIMLSQTRFPPTLTCTNKRTIEIKEWKKERKNKNEISRGIQKRFISLKCLHQYRGEAQPDLWKKKKTKQNRGTKIDIVNMSSRAMKNFLEVCYDHTY